jgi:hypothetical protein
MELICENCGFVSEAETTAEVEIPFTATVDGWEVLGIDILPDSIGQIVNGERTLWCTNCKGRVEIRTFANQDKNNPEIMDELNDIANSIGGDI